MSSNSPDYKNFSSLPPPAPPTYAGTAQGIPVGYATTTRQSNRPVEWSTGLCDCFSDWTTCCVTCWCPCITFGQIAEIVDKGSSSCALNGAVYTLIMCLLGCPYFYSCFYRTKMREQYNLKGSPCGDSGGGDCLLHCCCEQCALCQEYRELQSRGYDMSKGWHANAERNQEVGMTGVAAPIVQEGMRR